MSFSPLQLCCVCLAACIVCRCASGQDVPPSSSCTFNCDGNTVDFQQLQERLICLENAMDQLVSDQNQVTPDCSNVTNDGSGSGIYQLSPEVSDPFDALCIFDTDGKWTVIQQRFNGDVDFNRAWVEYRQGFGIMTETGNFWMGLEHLHRMTRQRQYTLRIDLQDWDDSTHYAEYSFFSISDEAHKYAIKLKGHSGTLPDALLSRSQNRPFSTFDEDNDSWANNCAEHFQTGWWHLDCYLGQVNGPYRAAGDDARNDAKGIIWKPYNGYYYSMKSSRMRIKPSFDN